MKIFPLDPKSKTPTPGWFKDEIKNLERTIDRRINNNGNNSNQNNGVPKNKVDFCKKCCLEFFYNVGPGYKFGIWIKVYNATKPNIWIRYGVNEKSKRKVNVYSNCNLDCIEMDFIAGYALPKDFHPKGIWMSHRGRRLEEITQDEIIDEICALLSCLCTAKCIE